VNAPVIALPHWREAGAAGAPCVFLLHGIGGGAGSFAAQLEPLARAGYRAVAWDMPGYGHSVAVEPFDFATLTAACLRLADHLAVRTIILVGHSLGGMLAQDVLARAPARIAGLVLAGTSASFGASDGAWQQSFLTSRTAPLDAGATMAELALQVAPGLVANGTDAAVVAAAVSAMAGVPESTYRNALALVAQFDRRAGLSNIGVPTLLIAGDEDRTAPLGVMERMAARIGGARLVCLERCGHLMTFERPEAFQKALLDFLLENFPVSTFAHTATP